MEDRRRNSRIRRGRSEISGGQRAEIDSSLAKQGEIIDFLEATSVVPIRSTPSAGSSIPSVRHFRPRNADATCVCGDFLVDGNGQPTNADYVVVHELVHQWFGDDVALRRWRDIWLNEGFATYFEYLWDSSHGGLSPRQLFDAVLAALSSR